MAQYEPIEGDHVLSLDEGNLRVPGKSDKMLTVGEIVPLFQKNLVQQNLHWFQNGVRCRLLKLGSDKWLRGTVKIRLTLSVEFRADDGQD